MKKQIIRLVALVLFASVTLTSCSVEYRNAHRHPYDEHHDDHHYDRY